MTAVEPYSVRCCELDGTLIAELTYAEPGEIVETLNTYDTFDIQFPKNRHARTDVDVIGRAATGPMEVHVLVGETLIAKGPAISATPNGGKVKLNCAGRDWHFSKRNLDAPPVNYLPNANFEDGLDNWTVDGSVTATVVTSPNFGETNSIELTALAQPTGGIKSDTFDFTTVANPQKLTYTVSFLIDTFIGPAVGNAGVLVTAGPIGGVGGFNAKKVARFPIDSTTQVGEEVRVGLSVLIPPNVTWAVQVTLFGISGTIYWGVGYMTSDKTFTIDGVTGAGAGAAPPIDVNTIVRLIADQAWTAANGKSDLLIDLTLPTVGVVLARGYEASAHISSDQALAELLERDDCFDYVMAYTDTTSTFVLHPMSAGPGPACGRGTDRSATVTLTYGAPYFVSYEPAIDGGSVVTQAGVLGDGSGSAREERWATETTETGGLVLQGIVNAPAGTRRHSLLPMARSVVTQQGAPMKTISVTVNRVAGGYTTDPSVILQDFLHVGDIVSLLIDDGWWLFGNEWRIVQRTRHCREYTMTYVLNRIVI